MRNLETVELYKDGKLIKKGTRKEISEYLGIKPSYLSYMFSTPPKGKYACYSFKVIPPRYEVLKEGEVIFTGSRYEIMDKFEVQDSQFAKVLMGVTRLNRKYQIRRCE